MSDTERSTTVASSKLMHYGMMACWAFMLLPVAAFFIAGGTTAGLWSNAGVFAPIVLCVGMHVVIHKILGKSCHGSKDEKPNASRDAVRLADVRLPAQDVAR